MCDHRVQSLGYSKRQVEALPSGLSPEAGDLMAGRRQEPGVQRLLSVLPPLTTFQLAATPLSPRAPALRRGERGRGGEEGGSGQA